MGEGGPLGVGLIGAGKIGRVHARNLAERLGGARLVAVADPDAGAASTIADRLGVSAVYAAPEDLLAHDGVEAVVIASPAPTHASLIHTAAASGRHVFCEKPIALDLAVIDEALGAVARAGITLQVGFQRRFDRSFRQARDLVAAGRVGRPRLVRVTSRDPQPGSIQYLRESGGLFMDMTIHDFDVARFLIADEVEEVTALGAVLVDPAIGAEANDVDTAIVMLRYAGGALGVIDTCRQAAYGYDQRAEVLGSEGAVMVGNEELDRTTLITADGARNATPKLVHRPLRRRLCGGDAGLRGRCPERPPTRGGRRGRARAGRHRARRPAPGAGRAARTGLVGGAAATAGPRLSLTEVAPFQSAQPAALQRPQPTRGSRWRCTAPSEVPPPRTA